MKKRLPKNSVFDRIYKVVKKIPKGKVTTYGWISDYLCINNSRIVGWALHANRNPEIACHRVVNKDGKIAENYAFGGWKKQKEKLIKERVGFEDEMHINLLKYGIMSK